MFLNEFVDAYDLLIDWPKRLANEAPFFRKRFAEAGVERVLDAACGTGRHAEMFYNWGLNVEGADISPAMIQRCRERFGERERLHWVERSFENSCEPPRRFDAVICIGNSLALVEDAESVSRAVVSLMSMIRAGGLGVIQVLNLWKVLEGPKLWKERHVGTDDDEKRVLLKGLHRVGSRGYIELIDLRMSPAGAARRMDSTSFQGIEAESLSAAIGSNGGRNLRLYGGYQEEPYHREQSTDLICVFQA
ncbi:MAG TPA: class I SAM-dependent methyltransferase [Phycisphaerae bacterium]|nr:class I SAM-dependent methyltransferase [Phycisphaerae bacterium]